MESVPLFFDRLDKRLERKIDTKNLSAREELAQKYMRMQGIFALSGLSLMLLVAWFIGAKMMAEFAFVYIPFMIVAGQIMKRSKQMLRIIFLFKISMIVVSAFYIMRMGGILTCGGLFLLTIQGVTSSVIMRDIRRIFAVAFTFLKPPKAS